MTLSPEEIELIDKVALGEIPIHSEVFRDLRDEMDEIGEFDHLYMSLLSNLSLTDGRRSELEKEIIDELFNEDGAEFVWEFSGGYLRHRFIAEYYNTSDFTFDLDFCLKKIAPYLANEYIPKIGEPSAKFILFSLVKESIKDSIRFGYSCQASDLIKLVEKGYFDSFDAQMKEDLLKLIFEYGCQEKTGTDIDDIIYAWIKRGLLGGMSWDSQQKRILKEWVKARPDLDRYLEAGFWETLSVHERALMIVPLLDRVESAIQAYPGIIRFLRLENPSPLLTEVKDELDRLTQSFSTLFYETHKNNDMIYNNKLSIDERSLVRNINSLLKPLSLVPIDCPLTILSDEDETPVKCENPNDFECLGYYAAKDRKIVLLRNKIHDTATEMNVPENILRTVVFIHELGHYYSHCLPLWKTESWKTSLFNGTSSGVLEGWAQLFALWAVKSNRECGDVFWRLLQDQSYVYHVFEDYERKWTPEELLHSLDGLRELDHPATVIEWNNLL